MSTRGAGQLTNARYPRMRSVSSALSAVESDVRLVEKYQVCISNIAACNCESPRDLRKSAAKIIQYGRAMLPNDARLGRTSTSKRT